MATPLSAHQKSHGPPPYSTSPPPPVEVVNGSLVVLGRLIARLTSLLYRPKLFVFILCVTF